MLSKLSTGACALGLALASAGLSAAGFADQAEVADPYVRAVPPGQMNSASFMTIRNPSADDRALVAAASPAAEVVELHTHTLENGMMRMRKIERIDLPAGQSVQLQPGGLHVMLIGLTGALKPDTAVDLTLEFDDGSRTTLQAPVRKVQMGMMPMQHGGAMH